MKGFTLGKNLINVHNVASVLVNQEGLKFIKEFTLDKSLMNVKSVTSVLAVQET